MTCATVVKHALIIFDYFLGQQKSSADGGEIFFLLSSPGNVISIDSCRENII